MMKRRAVFFIISVVFSTTFANAQSTWNFSTAATLSKEGSPYFILAKIKIAGVDYNVTHMGNGNFTNQNTMGNGNSAMLQKDGAGADFLEIRRADSLPFQFYGMWLKVTSINNPPTYQPPYFNIKFYDAGNAEIAAETLESSTQVHTLSVTKSLKVTYVRISFNAVQSCYLDDLTVGPALVSVATVTTSSVNQFMSSSALLGGNVTYNGDTAVTERGIVYNTSGSPTIEDTKIQMGSGTGTFFQNVSGLSNATMYYVKAYSINGVGTSYGGQQTFTTAGAFVLAQTHYFNTAWVSTTGQSAPFTKYVEGWNITATATGGTVSVSRITGLTGTDAAGEGTASARAQSVTSAEDLVSIGIKAADSSLFDLQSFNFKYLVKTAGSSFETITVTGYRNGVVANGAIASMTGIAEATNASFAYSTFDLTGNSGFRNIDEFRLTASTPVNSARLASLDIDVLKVAVPGVLPLRLLQLTGTVVNKKTVLKWRTAQEQNTAGFEVQHSIDGGSFLTIGSVLASGNNAAGKSYQFTDGNPVAGINYYRLKIVDRDGSCTYSAVVKLKADENSQLQLYPNPATGDYLTATGVFNGGNPQAYSIYSATGVKVKEGNLGQATQKISLARLAKGYYTIRLSNGQTGRIIRQ